MASLAGFTLRTPQSPAEWDAYFDLRWRVLRQPWRQQRGSERDSTDESAFHLLLLDSAGQALACGRLHLNSPGEAQVRYMAVEENGRGRGYGSQVLTALETEARRLGAGKIVLNARENAVEFYAHRGYGVIGEAETLFGAIPHTRMAKSLT